MIPLVDAQIIAIALLVAYACTIPGIFLTLRGMALMSDAISHAILPGIVIMFLFTHNLHSPLLMLAASATGLCTVLLTETLIAGRCLKKDAAIGLVFPLFFSLGVIVICLYARTVHLDIDMVIMGEIVFAPFNTMTVAGYSVGPYALWHMIAIFVMNSLFVGFCYKELQLTTFNPSYAHTLGLSPWIIQYILMCLTSITCVGAFDIVGSIVVVALIICPAATGYLFSKTVERMLLVSFICATGAVLIGYVCARFFDVSIAGSIATINGLFFIGGLLFSPKYGLYKQWYTQNKQWYTHALAVVCWHLQKHHALHLTEINTLCAWGMFKTNRIVHYAVNHGYAQIDGDLVFLTSQGTRYAHNMSNSLQT